MKLASRASAKATITSILAALVAVTVSACGESAEDANGPADQAETKTIRVATAVDKYYGYMPVQAHDALQTFKDTGLKVEVISATTPTIGQIMAANQADVAMAGAGAVVAHETAGIPVKLTAGILGPWDYHVLVSNKGKFAGAKRLEELKGANFGITGKGSPGNYMLSQYADKLGWSPSDYRETALGDVGALFAALTAGKVDAVLWAADRAYITEAQGVATYFKLPDVTPNVLQAFAVNKDFLKENPQTVKDFLTAYYAKVKELQGQPQPFVDVLVNDWKVDPAVASKLAENQLPLLSTDGNITDEQLAGIAKSVPFLSGKPDSAPPKIEYTPWQELGS